MAKTLPPPQQPPTKADLLELFRRTVPSEFWRPLADRGDGTPTDAYALFRGIAKVWEQWGVKAARTVQGRYYLPSALQVDIPATSGRPATGTVALSRVGNTSNALVVDPGVMAIVGPGDRRYVNAERIVWNPGDTAQRAVTFACEVLGYVGNLDFLAGDDGRIDLDLFTLADQDTGRAATGGSILATDGASIVQDSGVPDLFLPTDVGLYVAINAAANAQNVGASKRIVGWAWPEVEIPVGTGRYPRRVTLDGTERRNVTEPLGDDGGVFTDYYEEASDEAGVDDVPLLPAVPLAGDAFYFGFPRPFTGVEIRFDTPGEGDWVIAWEYWDGSTWVELDMLDDPTNGFRPSSDSAYLVGWAQPLTWATLASPAGSGLTLYYVRARVDSIASITEQPLAGRIVAMVPDMLVVEANTVTWALQDFAALGVQIDWAEAPGGGRDDDLWLMGDDRGVYQQAGEPDDVFRDRASRLADVVSPNAIQRAVNRALRPLGYYGKAIDQTIDTTVEQELVGAGFTGLFFDIEPTFAPTMLAAFDLYGAGDLYPQNPWFVVQSAQEAYGWFLVVLPYLGNGDFGIFFDDGPLYYDEVANVFYSCAFDGWMDGYPVLGYATYSAIYSAVDRIRAGGVGFTMVRSEALTVPGAC